MPLYEYKCTECGRRFEALRSIDRRDDVACDKCGAKVVRVYQGRCAFGVPKGGSGCSGNCSGCSGCAHGH